MKYQIAIVDANTLTALALKSILQDLVPFAQISTYSSPKELLKEETALIVHAFVSAKIFASSQELKSAATRHRQWLHLRESLLWERQRPQHRSTRATISLM